MSLIAIAGLVAHVRGDSFVINTPSDAVECEALVITWSGGVAPYRLSIRAGSHPVPIDTENVSGTSFVWTVTEPAGDELSLEVTDSAGSVAQSSFFTVQAGSDDSCIPQ